MLLVSAKLICQEHNMTPFGDESAHEITSDITHVSKSYWRPIQEKINDTVVQIFSQVAEFDWLQPYRTPNQYGTRGSGFFINDQGYIITNAHVIDQALAVWIQIPSLGKRLIDVRVVGICPDRDLALLCVVEDDLKYIIQQRGNVPFLPLGNSDTIYRADEVLALGYPLGQESLKSTSGVISGREQNCIQTSAPINPGSSGGPLINMAGEVIGINRSGILEANAVGYAIPVNDLKIILPNLIKVKLLRNPYLGIVSANGTETLTSYLRNPLPGGCYIVEKIKNSPLAKAGVEVGDMIYEINGNRLDIYGDMKVPWSEDKISISDYVSRLAIGQDVNLTIYRNGERKEIAVKFDFSEVLPIRKIYPGYEKIDHEIFGGMVVMELTINHIKALINQAPGLARYAEYKNQSEPVLIVTHIFPTSQLFRSRTLSIGATLIEINGIPVKTLSEFRNALQKGFDSNYFTVRAFDNVSRGPDNLLVVLPFDKLLQEENMLSHQYHYPISEHINALLTKK